MQSEKQGNASLWLPAAMAAPLAQTAADGSLPAVLAVGAVCLGICRCLERLDARPSLWLWAVQWFWLSPVLAEFLRWTTYCWTTHEDKFGVPLILLALAAWLAAKGQSRADRACSVLFWLLAFLFGAVLLSGVREVEFRNLYPQWRLENADLAMVFLIPAMGLSLKSKPTGGKLRILVFSLATAAVTIGVLGSSAAKDADCAFYELSRSISLLGVADRFESLVAAGMTLGYFVLLTYLLSACREGAEQIRGGKGAWGVWSNAALTAVWFLLDFRLSGTVLTMGSLLTWAVLPALNCLQRNLQKFEKTS